MSPLVLIEKIQKLTFIQIFRPPSSEIT